MSTHSEVRHNLFATKVVLEMKTPSQAYAEVYGRDANNPATRAAASRLLRHVNVQTEMDKLSDVYKGLAEWALTSQIDLALNPTTPAAVKFKIYSDILDRAGHRPPKKIQATVKEEEAPPEFNLNREELQKIIEQGERSDKPAETVI